MRPLDAVVADATALFAQAATLMRRARGLRLELEAMTATGTDEAERLVHGAIAAGIEAGLVQRLEAALRGLREARPAAGGAEPAWLRRLLDGMNCAGSDADEGHHGGGSRVVARAVDWTLRARYARNTIRILNAVRRGISGGALHPRQERGAATGASLVSEMPYGALPWLRGGVAPTPA
jgi:hypothetical protein